MLFEMGNKESVGGVVTNAYQTCRDDASDLLESLMEMNAESRKTRLETKIKDGDDLLTALIIAARDGMLDIVRDLLCYEADIEAHGTIKINEEIIEGCTALWVAAAKGHLDVVKLLIERNAEVDSRTSIGSTPLRVAAFFGRLDIVSFLCENGANVKSRTINNSTPLMIACYNGHMDVASYLVEHGADVHVQDNNGDTCLHFAARKGHVQIVGELLAFGAKQERNLICLTPLLEASNNCNIEMVEYLINRPECTKEQRIDALELLGATIANDPDAYDIDTAFTYMKRGMEERYADPTCLLRKKQMEPVEAYQNSRESQTLEELSQLEGYNHAIHMEGLIIRERILGTDNTVLPYEIRYRGAQLAGSKNYELCIPLWTRAMEIAMNCDVQNTEELKLLTALFAKIVNNGHDLSPRHIENIFEKVVDGSRKLSKKVEPGKLEEDQNNKIQETLLLNALYLLVMYSKVQAPLEVKNGNMFGFLQRFLHSNPRNQEGNTLSHLAVWHKTPVLEDEVQRACKFPCIKAMKLILHAGCDVNAANTVGNTPLHLAVTFKPGPEQGDTLKEMLELLLDFGADTNLANNNGKTAMVCCETEEAREMLRRGSRVKKVDTKAVRDFSCVTMF